MSHSSRISTDTTTFITASIFILPRYFMSGIRCNISHYIQAFRWVSQKRAPAEWILLVEDDFPLCHGKIGWDAVSRVMSILESSRIPGEDTPDKRAGFVGTGGSGLVIHKSLIPILILLMRTHAEIDSKLPANADRRPPDVVVQDCLLGVDLLCPKSSQGANMVITSRLMMDHIGGMFSTTPGKQGNSDKWRCNWRHPFHGRREVEVVVV
ncbi:hypothetical protein C8J56DRAFT_934270 [Mycena floridula]|nr:hypothetical protein C8J56DRAFT_934270 [Mycena floridula]